MKIVIWIGFCFIYGLIVTFLRQKGVVVGGINAAVLATALFFTARKLCKMWDEKQGIYEEEEEEEEEEEAQETTED